MSAQGITDAQLQQMRANAAELNEHGVVEDCDRALAGSASARLRCAQLQSDLLDPESVI